MDLFSPMENETISSSSSSQSFNQEQQNKQLSSNSSISSSAWSPISYDRSGILLNLLKEEAEEEEEGEGDIQEFNYYNRKLFSIFFFNLVFSFN